MASPASLKVVPNCGLHIKVVGSVLNAAANYDETEPIKYQIINKGNFNLRSDYVAPQSEDIFSGWLSPASEVSLPPVIKELAGVPLDAQHYAFMHPPMGLAEAIDWENPINSSESFFDSPDLSAGRSSLRISKYNHNVLKVNKKAMADACFLGGFVYFDEHFHVLCVNAITLQSENDDYFLKLSGPFATTDAVGPTLIKKNRVHALTLDIFHEAGLSACSWVLPDEIFEDKPLSHDHENMNGALVFFRDDSSSFAYMVDNSDTSHPKGNVEILPEIIQSLPSNFLNDKPKFLFKFLDFRETEKWRQLAGEIIEENDDDWEDDLRNTLKDPNTLLHNSCLARLDHNIILQLLENRSERINLSYPDKFGWFPLHYACRYHQNLEVIKLLLYYSPAAIKHQDPFGRYPLHIACMNRDSSAEVIELLLEGEGRSIICERTKRIKMTPLYMACDAEAKAEVIRVLLDADTNGDTIQLKSKIGRLPLHLAIDEKMDPEIIEMLLNKDEELEGKNDNYIPDILQDRGGFLPLHTAVWNASDAATVKLLLDKDEDGGTVRKKIEFRGDAKNTRAWRVVPLHLAVKRGIPEVIRLLLMKEKNIKDARKEVKRGIPEGIRRPKKKYKRNSTQDFLINSTLEMKDYKGRTPLHIACQKGADVNITQSLLDADPLNKALHELDHNGFKPFHHSCNKADATPEVVQLLLNEEEKMHLTFTGKKRMTSSIDKRNRSPLYLALSKGAPESVIEILTRPEYFYLKGLDVVVLEKLATIVSQNDVIQDNVIKKLSDRSYFTVLFVELYAYIIAVFAFLEGSENLLQNQRITWEPVVLVVSIVLFLLREVAQIKSEGISYVKDKWSWLEVASTILLSICVKEMFQEEFVMEPTLFTVTGILLILQFIFYLRATFLPFATFVGGLLQIFNDLVPFYVVSFLLLLAFTFAFVALEGYEEKCPNMQECLLYSFSGFFSGLDNVERPVEVIFGIVVIIVLLNVVIAIVSDSWKAAVQQTKVKYWSFRLSFIMEMRIFSIIEKNFLRGGLLEKYTGFIDQVEDVTIAGDAVWSKEPYFSVKSKSQYNDPFSYFGPDLAEKIKAAHSLQADLYWVRHYWKKEHGRTGGSIVLESITVTLQWMGRALLYLFLLIFGSVTGGYFWPVRFRRGVLYIGIRSSSKSAMKS